MAYVATFQGKAATEHIDALKKSMQRLANESVKQPGTIRYEFYQSEDEPEVFLLFAIWETEADWQTHVSSEAHIQHVESLPSNAWEVPPKRVVWNPVSS